MTEAFPVTTGLKVLKTYVYADVTLGYLTDQGRVTTQVRASVNDPEVTAALKPLLDLLAARAHGVVRTADLQEQIEAGVRDSVRSAAEDERSRVRRSQAAELEQALGSTDRELEHAVTRMPKGTYEHRLAEQARGAVRRLITGRE